MICVISFITLIGCESKNTSMDNNNLENIREVFQKDKADIIKKYKASGAGIGKRGDIYVIVVHNSKTSFKEREEHWKNIPLRFEDIGEIRLQ